MTSSSHRQRAFPWLVAALLCTAALGLTLHTAISRHERWVRATAETARNAADPPDPEFRSTYSSRSSSGRPQTPEQTEKAVAKRVRDALSITHPLDRMRAMLGLMEGFSSEDFRVALKTCDASGHYGATLNVAVAYEWTLRFPADALAAMQQENYRRRQDCLLYLLGQDEDSALRLVRGLKDEKQRCQDLTDLLLPVTQAHPDQTLEILHQLPIDDQRQAAWRICSECSAETFAELIRWAETQTDPEARKQAIQAMSTSANPKATAAQFAMILRHPDLMSAESMGSFFGNWAFFDSAAAAAAMDEMPEGDLRTGAMRQLVPHLAAAGRMELALDLIERSPGAADDSLWVSVTTASARSDPASALEQMGRITDAFLRDRTTAETLLQWQRNDPAAATAWMKDHEISASVRQKMEAAPRPPGS